MSINLIKWADLAKTLFVLGMPSVEPQWGPSGCLREWGFADPARLWDRIRLDYFPNFEQQSIGMKVCLQTMLLVLLASMSRQYLSTAHMTIQLNPCAKVWPLLPGRQNPMNNLEIRLSSLSRNRNMSRIRGRTTIEDERELLEISVKTEPIKRVLPPRNIQPPKASDHINVGNEIFMPVQIPEPHVCDPSVPITREKF